MRFHAFAHTCTSEKGHQLYYHTATQRAIEELNLPYRAYIPYKHALPSPPDNWIPHFPPPYERKEKHAYLKACQALFQKERGAFFIETLTRRDLRYFALSALRFGRKGDHLCLLFRDDRLLRRQRDFLETRLFLTLLKKKFGNHLILLTDTDNLSTFFSQKCRLPFHTMPIPLYDISPKKRTRDRLTLLFPGEPRREKGEAVVRRLLHKKRSCHFICEESLGGDEGFPQTLSRERYLALLERCDALFLPYDAAAYRNRSSGIFVEGIAMGKVCVVPDGCWMADELRKHALEPLILNFEREDVLDTVESLCKNNAIQKRLSAMQRHYLAFHTPHTFAQELCTMLPIQKY